MKPSRAVLVFLLLVLVPAAFALTIFHDENPVVVVGDDTFTVAWTTDEPSISNIGYGITAPLESHVQNNTFKKTHRLVIDGLQPGTTYLFQILALSESGANKIDDNSGQFYKARTSQGDRFPPSFSNITTDTTAGATISWRTSEPATSMVFYGEREPTILAQDDTLTTNHELSLEVETNTAYVMIVGGCDEAGNCANATRSGFYTGGEGMPLELTVPVAVTTQSVDIVGKTVAGARVTVLVDGQASRGTVAGNDGSFRFAAVKFSGSEATIKVLAKDNAGNEAEKEFTIASDPHPPKITLNAPIPNYLASNTLTLTGKVDKPVTLTYGIQQEAVTIDRVLGVKATQILGNAVHLEWERVQDATAYAIYRDGTRVAVVTDTKYSDGTSAGTVYRYRVAAVHSCAEGPQSEIFTVTTPNDGQKNDVLAQEASISCAQKASTKVEGDFSITIDLGEGDNTVVLEAKDRAGNIAKITGVTKVDSEPIEFIEDNLAELSPSYTSTVKVRGRLNKPGTVLIYLNDDKPIGTLTDEAGVFSKEINLERNEGLKDTKTPSASASYTAGWNNKVRLEAVDLAGRKASRGPTTITYAMCGSGGAFSIDIGTPMPDVLIPRLILQGVQEAGFMINASYRGGNALATPVRISVRPVTLSQTEEKKYDHDWVSVSPHTNARKPSEAFVSLLVQAPPEIADKKGTTDKEVALGEHREGDCKVPGFGCVKMLLVVEVQAQEKLPKRIGDPRVQPTVEDFELRDISQRTCIDVEFMIDRPLALSQNIPTEFLNTSIQLIDSLLDGIDSLLDPLMTVGTYTTYGCLAMNGILYGMFTSENLACDFANLEAGPAKLIEKLLGGNDIRDIASIGMCDSVFATPTGAAETNENKAALASCKKCEAAIVKRVSLEKKMRLVCDRVACPSAPTLQTYIQDKQAERSLKQVILKGVDGAALIAGETLTNNLNGKIYTGSSCAFQGESGQTLAVGYGSYSETLSVSKSAENKPWSVIEAGKTRTATSYEVRAIESTVKQGQTVSSPFSVSLGQRGVKTIYLDYLKHKEDKSLTPDELASLPVGTNALTSKAQDGINCAGLHPANPACCGYEYYDEWSSACGVPGIAETFDELKESACLSATNANQIRDFERSATETSGSPVVCKSLFNSVAGLCEPDSGQPVGDVLPTGIRYSDATSSQLAAPETNEVYIHMMPAGQDNKEYVIMRGYIRKRVVKGDLKASERMDQEKAKAESIKSAAGSQSNFKDRFYLNAELDFVPDLDGGSDLTNHFKIDPNKPVQQGQLPPGFSDALCINAADKNACKGTLARRVYDDVRSRIGITDKTYIVRPDRDGVLRSAQCVCLPAVTSYLQYWRNVLGAVRGCFSSVLLTGDPDAGICQAVLSQYVCDMLFDAISCATQHFSTPGAGTTLSGRGGLGDVMGSLSKAGGDMRRSISGRYGDTAMYKTMFVERKLLHSMCAFAFTGTWKMDIEGVFSQTVDEIPIKTQGILYPSERRFVSFTPFSRPSGLPTFLYHFGVGLAAGDDIRYQLELVCSNSARCEPKDGFEAGKCDCFGRAEQRVVVGGADLTGMLKKNEILNTEVFYTIQGGDPYSKVRYDTAVLTFESMDASGRVEQQKPIEMPIKLVGGRPPNICKWDAFALAYRCDIGIGEYSGARIVNIKPVYPDGNDAFVIGKPMAFEITASLTFPEDQQRQYGCSVDCPYTKWLNYEIKNQLGQPIRTLLTPETVMSTPSLRFGKNGEETKTITVIGAVTADLFSQSSVNLGIESGGGSADFSLATVTRTGAPGQNYVVVMKPMPEINPTYYELSLYVAGSRVSSGWVKPTDSILSSGKWGWFEKLGAKVASATLQMQGSYTFKDQGITVYAQKISAKDAPWPEFLVIGGAFQATSQCKQNADKPVDMGAVFTMYDSTQAAGGSTFEYNPQQPTVDPSSSEPQQKAVTFKAICANSWRDTVSTQPRFCSEDERVKQLPCYCGTVSEYDAALAKWQQDKVPFLNCGTGTGSGDYCVKSGTGRTCSSSSGSSVTSSNIYSPDTITFASGSSAQALGESTTVDYSTITSTVLYPRYHEITVHYATLPELVKATAKIGSTSVPVTVDHNSFKMTFTLAATDIGSSKSLTLDLTPKSGQPISATMGFNVEEMT